MTKNKFVGVLIKSIMQVKEILREIKRK